MKTTSLRLAVYAIILISMTGCAALYRNIQAPEVQIAGIETRGFDQNMQLQLTARLKIHNPNDIALPVRGGTLVLQINGTEIGTASLENGFDIAARGDKIVAIPARLKFNDALAVGMDILSKGERQAEYQLIGHIDLAVAYLGRVPVNNSGTLTVGG